MIWAKAVSLPDSGGAEFQKPLTVDGPGRQAVTRFFINGQRFAAEHGFVYGRGPRQYVAIHRNPLTGPDNDHRPFPDLSQRDLFFLTVFNDKGRFGLHADEFANGAAGFALGAGFEHLAQFNQRDDDGGGFEIDMAAGGGNQQDGQGIKIGHGRSQSHQDVHIGAFIAQALEAADIIVTASVKLDRCGQSPEQPVDPGGMAPGADQSEIAGHAKDKQRQREKDADEKLAGLIADFSIPGRLFGISPIGCVIGNNGAVAGFFDGGHDLLEADHAGQIIHRCPFGCEVDRGVDDPFGFFYSKCARPWPSNWCTSCP